MIIYFTGNGNSRLVAERLAGATGDALWCLDAAAFASMAIDAAVGERVVWVMPVHSWGMPRAVARYIAMVRVAAGVATVPHYLALTCGDDCGLTVGQWRRAMAERGWRAVSAFSVAMPNTYTLMPGFDVDSPEVASRKLGRMPERVAHIASAILAGGGADDVTEGSFPWMKSRVVYPWFMRWEVRPGKFHADERCVACGRCRVVCPLGNITSDGDGRPRWGGDCTLCLGCYNCCPRHAIGYGGRTKGKGQYFAG